MENLQARLQDLRKSYVFKQENMVGVNNNNNKNNENNIGGMSWQNNPRHLAQIARPQTHLTKF